MIFVLYLVVIGIVYVMRRRDLLGLFLQNGRNDSVSYFKTLGKRGETLQPYVGTKQTDGTWFVIRHEKWYHRTLKALGLATEIQTGDTQIDDKLFFKTDSPDHLEAALRAPGVLDHIRTLFIRCNVAEIRSVSDKLWAKCATVDTGTIKSIAQEDVLNRHMPAIQGLADALDAGKTATPEPAGFSSRHIAFFYMFAHSAFLGLGVVAGLPALLEKAEVIEKMQLFYYAGPLAGILAALWAAVIFLTLQRSCWLPLIIADFTLLGLAGILLSTPFVVREVNIELDKSPVVIKTQPVDKRICKISCSKSTGSGKRRRTQRSTHYLNDNECLPQNRDNSMQHYRSTDYICANSANFNFTLEVAPWMEGQTGNYSFSVNSGIYDASHIGSKFDIPTHAGAVGITWVIPDEIKPAP